MITDAYSQILTDVSMRSVLNNEDLSKLLREQRLQQEVVSETERELNRYRSGSAPPTVEGSLSSMEGLFGPNGIHGIRNIDRGGFFTEEEMRSDPAYGNYYYSNGNLNPRLPPPLFSKEDWRSSQRLHGAGGVNSSVVGDRRNRVGRGRVVGDNEGNGRLLIGSESGFVNGGVNEENAIGNGGGVWGRDGLIGLSGVGLGSRKKSIAEIIQDDMVQAKPISRHPSCPASRNAFDVDAEDSGDQFAQIHSDLASIGALQGVPAAGASAAQTYASALSGSLSRSTTPDPQLIARAPSPRIPPIGGGRTNPTEKRDMSGLMNPLNGVSSGLNDSSDVLAALSGLNLSTNGIADENSQYIGDHHNLFNLEGDLDHIKQQSYLKHFVKSSNSFNKASVPIPKGRVGSPSNQASYEWSSYSLNPSNLPPLFETAGAPTFMPVNGLDSRGLGLNLMPAAAEMCNLNRFGNQIAANTLRAALTDPLCSEYIRSHDPTMDLFQKACLEALLSQKSPYGVPYAAKSGSVNQNYYPSSAFGLGIQYPGSPLLSNSPMRRHGERSMQFSSGINLEEAFPSSLLDEFKSNKTKSFELSDIKGHVVKFSADQYGSRFIQQKLETATVEEKDMVYNEILPNAITLMTDVFGNYVIQKFLEHGSPSQIRELADKLTGHVLTLSLQMYGCRVIQKSIEVVELDQKKCMVKELDGHIMRCVRDQNGNHVIQKCIECVPEDAIQFIVSTFYDQVVTLSTHPYGCRVIQRVLEHCHSAKTQQIMMSEIMQFVCMLAQDQYGNYVVQHVLEHGKPHERTEIVEKLTGKIVQMSQQKFASNVIEKCLTFGTATEREALVNEMLGTTDENEPLQVMMKDQFANYVVQKVLETCNDQQLELILNRIKIHLNALKKYTYGKHIVARVEKLVAAGERRINTLNLQSAAQVA